ncbi:MAG TPA: Spy/CpxP family protein refolding chaperone [Sandaracinaceae bacterium LLY-WYZ-13_1]|nr:Spy/CpxP family protein refolding chaperone [Sandaracinaceae bacterium LLY-WYZ-13_1]
MLGFLIGFASLFGLIAMLKRGRGCGRGWHGHHHGPRRRHGGRGGWRRGGPRRWLRFLYERLDTTPGQEKEIAAAVEGFVEQARSMKREARTSRDDVAKVLRDDGFDETTLGELFGRHDERVRDLQKAFADALGRVHQALDPEQRQRLAALIESGHGPDFGGPYRGGWA